MEAVDPAVSPWMLLICAAVVVAIAAAAIVRDRQQG